MYAFVELLMLLVIVSYKVILFCPHVTVKFCALMSILIPLLQTIETIPDGLMDIAKANSGKNRYHNIYTCESENAVVCIE